MENDTSPPVTIPNNVQGLTKEQQIQMHMRKMSSIIVNFGSFAGLYGLILVCLATIFILSTFIGADKDSSPSQKIYPHVFNLLVHAIGGIFILTTYRVMRNLKAKIDKARKLENQKSYDLQSAGIDNIGFEEDYVPHHSTSIGSSFNTTIKGLTLEELREKFLKQPIDFSGEGGSFFARMGLLGFGLGATLLDGTRLMQYINNPDVMQCYGRWYIASSSVNIAYNWIVIFFIMKYHDAIINVHRAVIKFGLAHLMATNMGMWITTVVIEGATGDVLTNETTNITEDVGKVEMLGCIRAITIYDQAAPYLYPFVIEFSLLSTAALYHIYCNVGSIIIKDENGTGEEKNMSEIDISVDCHKAHTGLFYGFMVFLGVISATVLYIFYENAETQESLSGHPDIPMTQFIYIVTSICGNFLGLITLIPTVIRLCKLHFNNEVDSTLDQYLLVIAVAGYYMLFGLIAMAAIESVNRPGDVGLTATLLLVACILDFVQVTFQCITVIDGLHRRAGIHEHEQDKPGRSFVSFLVVLNMGLWIVNTFLSRSLHHMHLVSDFYGETAWGILFKIFMPLSIFFRFHSAVCFADIWQNAYKREKSSTLGFLDIAKKLEETMM